MRCSTAERLAFLRLAQLPRRRGVIDCRGRRQNKSRASPKADAANKTSVARCLDPEQVTPRGALRSMQRYRLHLEF